MSVVNHTPQSLMLQQVEGQWQKLLLLLLFKLAGRQPVHLTHAEIAACWAEFAPGNPTLLTQGGADRIVFQVITEAQALELAEHENRRLFGVAGAADAKAAEPKQRQQRHQH
jgi:hypothetical protein